MLLKKIVKFINKNTNNIYLQIFVTLKVKEIFFKKFINKLHNINFLLNKIKFKLKL